MVEVGAAGVHGAPLPGLAHLAGLDDVVDVEKVLVTNGSQKMRMDV